MGFDVEGARKAGYSDQDIASFLAGNANFDLNGAVKSGYSYKEVISFLAPPKLDVESNRPKILEALRMQGFDDPADREHEYQRMLRTGEVDSSIADALPAARDRLASQGRSLGDTLKDTAIDVAKMPVTLGESLVGMGDIVSGNAVGSGLSAIGYDPARTKREIEQGLGGYSDSRSAQNEKVAEAKTFADAVHASLTNPQALAGTLVDSSGLMLTGMGAARAVAARMLAAEGIAPGSQAAAEFFARPDVMAKLSSVSAAAEGAQTAGSIQEQARQQGAAWKDSVLPAVAGGAITGLIAKGASRLVPDAEAVAAVAGMGAGPRQELLAAGKDIAKQTFKEGFLEEMPQSAQEQVFTNLATGRPWDEGVGAAAGQGLVAGAAMGGGMSGYSAARNAQAAIDPLGSAMSGMPGTIDSAQWDQVQIDAAARGALSPANAQLVAMDETQFVTDTLAQAEDPISAAVSLSDAPIPLPDFSAIQNGQYSGNAGTVDGPVAGDGRQGADTGAGVGDPLLVPGLADGGSANAGTPARSGGTLGTLGTSNTSNDSLTNDIMDLEAKAGLASLSIAQRPSGTLEVSGPNARELVTQIAPGESVQQRKDGSVIVGLKHANTVRMAVQQAQMSLPTGAVPSATTQGVSYGLQGQEKGRRQEVLTPLQTAPVPATMPVSFATTEVDRAAQDALRALDGGKGNIRAVSPSALRNDVVQREYRTGEAGPAAASAVGESVGLRGAAGVATGNIIRFFSGRQQVVFEGDKDLPDGAVLRNDPRYVFVNADQSLRPITTVVHELSHTLRQDAPDVWNDFQAATERAVDRSDTALLSFLSETYDPKHFRSKIVQQRLDAGEDAGSILQDLLATHSSLKTRDNVLEEFNGDLMARASEHRDTWRYVAEDMARTSPGNLRKFIKTIDRMIKAVQRAFSSTPDLASMDRFVVGKDLAEFEQNLQVVRKAAGQALARYASRNQSQRDALFSQRNPAAPAVFSPKREAADQTLPTRWPTSVGASPSVNDPMLADLSALRQTPKLLEQAVAALVEEPGLRTKARSLDGKLESVLDKMVANLLWLHDQVPADIRARSKLWYDGAGEIATKWAKKYGKTRSQTAGILAVLSPQKDWFMNVTMGERVLDVLSSQMDHKFDAKMKGAAFQFLLKDRQKPEEKRANTAAFDAVKDLTLRETIGRGNSLEIGVWLRSYDEAHHAAQHAVIHPEGDFGENATTVSGSETLRAWGGFDALGKAASIFVDGSAENISQKLGGEHKVRNFYNNIFAPEDARFTTIDTHAVAADLLRPLAGADKPVADNFGGSGGSNLTGVSGTYPIHYEAYKRAAEARGILPREMQSITWEAVRGLFTEGFKGKKDNLKAIDNVWRQVDLGKLTADQAREQILQMAGGIQHPDWWDGKEPAPSGRDKSYAQARPGFGGTKVVFEVAPDPNNKELTARWNALRQEDKAAISYDLAWDVAGQVLSYYNSDTIKGELHTQVGGYLEDTNPSFSLWMNKYASVVKVAEIAHTLGFVLSQDSMVISSPKSFKGAVEMGAVVVRGVSDADAKSVYDELRAAIRAEDDSPLINGHTTAEGRMAILVDAGSEEGIGERVAEYLGSRHDVYTDSQFVQWPERGENDYGLSRQDEDRGGVSESPLRAYAHQLRAESQRKLQRRIEDAERGTVALSPRRADAGRDGRNGSRDAGAGQEVRGYGVSQPGSTVVTGVHYSRQERERLDGRYYGTGLQGAEGPRVRAAEDQRLRERVYFYVSKGAGVKPEDGVGSIAHVAQLNNVYDANADTWVQAKVDRALKGDAWTNAFESSVIDHGFDGYVTNFGSQRAAVLLGRHSVPVSRADGLGAGLQAQVPSTSKPSNTDADKVEQARVLPMGMMSGAEWKRLIPVVVPGVDVSMLEDGKDYYKSQVVSAMRGGAPVALSPKRAWYYSQLERSFEQAPDKVFGPAQQVKAWLLSNSAKLGIKQDEIQWTGIADWLDLQGKTRVSKQDVLDYLGQNGVQVEEVVKGTAGYNENEPQLPENSSLKVVESDEEYHGRMARQYEYVVVDRDSDTTKGWGHTEEEAIADAYSGHPGYWDSGDTTKYGQYVLPGGENYRELLLTLPEKHVYPKTPVLTPEENRRFSELTQKMRRDGSLPAAEMADWKALKRQRDQYDNELEDINRAGHNKKPFRSSHWGEDNILAHVRFNDRTDADGNRVLFIEELQSDWGQEGKKKGFDPAEKIEGLSSTGVPLAPFVTDTKAWLSLGLKRMIAYAVENGYDKVAFVNGQQSAERYDLSKQVDVLYAGMAVDGKYLIGADQGRNRDVIYKKVTKEELPDLVGKELAEKIINDVTDEDTNAEYRGLDLQVGGSGMKAFYDQIVPQAVNDVLKKLGGGKVEGVRIGFNSKRAKHPSQLGFSITPEMREKVAAGLPLFSPRRNVTGQVINASWASPDLTGFDNVVRALQDKLVDAKRVVFAIREAGTQIDTKFDPYSQEMLYHGRAAKRTHDFADGELKPLLNEMRLAGVSLQDMDDYLWAVHAPERNRQMAKINPNQAGLDQMVIDASQDLLDAEFEASQDPQDWAKHQAAVRAQKKLDALLRNKPYAGAEADRRALSGLSNAQARDILAGNEVTLASGRKIKLNPSKPFARLAGKVRAINDRTLQLLVDYGLEDQGTVDAWKATYSNYVPLNRDMESDDNYHGAFNLGLGTGQGFSVKGSSAKRATGSRREAVDILANLAMQRERAITRGEKNRVAMSVYALALKAPNPDFWLAINPDASTQAAAKTAQELVAMGINPVDAKNLAQPPSDTYTDPVTGLVVRRGDPRLLHRADVLAVRVQGKERMVVFSNDERATEMVRNLKNLDAEQLGLVSQGLAGVTRWFAAVNTQYNPVFGLVNGLRDMQSAVLNLGSTPLAGSKAKVVKYGLQALAGIYSDLRAHRKGGVAGSAWAQEFEEFGNEGGQTGYRDMFQTSKARTDALATALKDLARGKLTRFAVISEANPIFAWLADYNTAIENAFRVAAYKVAKEQGMGKQDAAILAKNLTVNFNKKGLASTQAGALYAFFNAAVQGTARIGETMLQHNGSPSDWKNLRLSKLGTQIVVGGVLLGVIQALLGAAAGFDDDEPKPFQREKNLILPIPGSDKYVTIPLPLGFHVFPNMGRLATEWALSGFKNTGDRAYRMLGVLMDAFNPLGSSDGFVQTLAPTILDPMISLYANKDWTGQRIYKEDFDKNKPSPGWTRHKDTATPWAKALSYGINYASGGGQYEKGILSPTPDQIDYIIGQVTGGVGRELGKAATAAKAAASGEELPLYKVPVVGRFVGEQHGGSSEVGRFYENLRRVGEHVEPLKLMQEAGARSEMEAYRAEHPDVVLLSYANRIHDRVSELDRMKRKMIEKGADPAKVKELEERRKALVESFNRRYAETVNSTK